MRALQKQNIDSYVRLVQRNESSQKKSIRLGQQIKFPVVVYNNTTVIITVSLLLLLRMVIC